MPIYGRTYETGGWQFKVERGILYCTKQVCILYCTSKYSVSVYQCICGDLVPMALQHINETGLKCKVCVVQGMGP